MQRIPRPIAIAALVFAATVSTPNAWGADSVENLHAHADRNKDGVVDRNEFNARQVDVFYFQDGDKDGALAAAELPRETAGWAAADANHDGKLELKEFLELRSHQFEAADANEDGALSLDELKAP